MCPGRESNQDGYFTLMKENSVLYFSYVRSTCNHPLKDSRMLSLFSFRIGMKMTMIGVVVSCG